MTAEVVVATVTSEVVVAMTASLSKNCARSCYGGVCVHDTENFPRLPSPSPLHPTFRMWEEEGESER